MSEKKSSKPSGIVTAYLVLYNVAQLIGWLAIAMKMVNSYRETGSYHKMYSEVQFFLEFFQTAALLEILHGALGFVHTNPIIALTQISSRIFITWHVHYCASVHTTISPFLFLTAWTVTEVVRYAFYTLNLVTTVPYILQWFRYTFFIFLYPMGVTGELLAVWFSVSFVEKTGLFTVALPNAVNMSFYYPWVLYAIMLSYVPNFPPLYMHMFKQRSKVIGGVDPKKSA